MTGKRAWRIRTESRGSKDMCENCWTHTELQSGNENTISRGRRTLWENYCKRFKDDCQTHWLRGSNQLEIHFQNSLLHPSLHMQRIRSCQPRATSYILCSSEWMPSKLSGAIGRNDTKRWRYVPTQKGWCRRISGRNQRSSDNVLLSKTKRSFELEVSLLYNDTINGRYKTLCLRSDVKRVSPTPAILPVISLSRANASSCLLDDACFWFENDILTRNSDFVVPTKHAGEYLRLMSEGMFLYCRDHRQRYNI